MNIICVYKTLKDSTRAAVEKYAPDAEFIYTGNDERQGEAMFDYWQAIVDRWTGQEDLVVIEGDIVINDRVIPAFAACPMDWCTFAYEYFGVLGYSYMGCTKYSAWAQQQAPIISRVSWWMLDGAIASAIKGLVPHCHGLVEHDRAANEYRPYSSYINDYNKQCIDMRKHFANVRAPANSADLLAKVLKHLTETMSDEDFQVVQQLIVDNA